MTKNRTHATTLTVRGRKIDIERIEWNDGAGMSFDVIDAATGLTLASGLLDTEPDVTSIEWIMDLFAHQLDAGTVDPIFDGRHHLLAQAVGRTFVIFNPTSEPDGVKRTGERWITVRPSIRPCWSDSTDNYDLVEAGEAITTADPFQGAPTLEQVTSYLSPRKRRLETLMVQHKIMAGDDYQYEREYTVLHGTAEAPRYVGIMRDETYRFLIIEHTLELVLELMASRLGDDISGALVGLYDLEDDASLNIQAKIAVQVKKPSGPEAQQPDTDGEMVRSQSPEHSSIKIEFDAATKSYYAGVAAGVRASNQLDELDPQTGFAVRIQYFWLKIGTELAQAVPDGNQEHVGLFIQGAALGAPADKRAASVVIESTASAGGENNEQEDDNTVARQEIAWMLRVASRKVSEGHDEGELTSRDGLTIGSFTVRQWSPDVAPSSPPADTDHDRRRPTRPVGPCPCECNAGGFCGGCGHAGCGRRHRVVDPQL